MPQDFYELVYLFIIYAMIGWCAEVAYAAVNTGKFVNRGFLNGPYCPIYGCGMIIVVVILTPIKDNLFILFIGSVLLTSTIEFFTGFCLEKIFHNKWWDYSNFPFNIKGYVCLKFSIYWGFACTFVMDILHPMIYKMITTIPFIVGIIILTIVMVIFATDMVITVLTILKFNRKISAMDEIAKKIHNLSDEMGEKVYKNVSNVMDKTEEFKNDMETKKESFSEEYLKKKHERDELIQKYKELWSQKHFGFKRLVKAFPNMKSIHRDDILQKYKEYIRQLRR